MNHSKCINDVLNRYNDFPGIQADMRRLLKYTESQFRMFLTPIIKDDIKTENAIDAIMEPYAADQEAQSAFTGVALAIRHGLTDQDTPEKIKNILNDLNHRPELRTAVVAVGKLLSTAAEEAVAESI